MVALQTTLRTWFDEHARRRHSCRSCLMPSGISSAVWLLCKPRCALDFMPDAQWNFKRRISALHGHARRLLSCRPSLMTTHGCSSSRAAHLITTFDGFSHVDATRCPWAPRKCRPALRLHYCGAEGRLRGPRRSCRLFWRKSWAGAPLRIRTRQASNCNSEDVPRGSAVSKSNPQGFKL